MRKSYDELKKAARDKAIDIQYAIADESMSWGEVAEIQRYLEKLGRRYGLLKEFRENGLC